MLHPIGTCVTYAREAWQVVGIIRYTRKLLSLDGKRVTYAAVDRLTPHPDHRRHHEDDTMDAITRREMTLDLVKAGIPEADLEQALTSAVSLASAGDLDPKAAVTTVVQVMVSNDLKGPTESEQVRLSNPTGDDWELQLGAALDIETATLAILTPDALIALPPTAFDMPEHPFSWDGSRIVVTRLVLDEHGQSLVLDDHGNQVNALDHPERPRLTTTTLHDLPAGWRIVEDHALTQGVPTVHFVQDPSYRLHPAT